MLEDINTSRWEYLNKSQDALPQRATSIFFLWIVSGFFKKLNLLIAVNATLNKIIKMYIDLDRVLLITLLNIDR